MTSNTFLTNSFVAGMNTDTDINLIPNTLYRYAENVRIITNDDGNTGVLQNIQDNIDVPGDIFLREGEKVLSIVTVEEYIVALTHFVFKGRDINSIYLISKYKNPPLEKVVVVSGELGYYTYSNVKMVANYESNSNIKLYIADGSQYLKAILLMDNKYVYVPDVVNPNLDKDGFIINPSYLDIITDSILKAPEYVTMNAGNLITGMVQYAYQFFNARGNNTLISQCSGLIHLTTSPNTDSVNNYKGSAKNINSGKSVLIKIPLLYNETLLYSDIYDYVRIYRIHYNDRTELPVIEIAGETQIPNDLSILQYEDIGITVLKIITIEEFNGLTNSLFIPATIEKKDNRLFAANIINNTFNPEYDSRAYRCTKNGKLILKDNVLHRNISQQLPEDPIKLKKLYESIEYDHDCTNPYNFVKGLPKEDEDCQYSGIKVDGKYILGGSGLNVSYRFIYTSLELDKMGSLYSGVVGDDHIILKDSGLVTKKISFNYLDDDSFADIEHVGDVYHLNYADPLIDANYKGYQRDEIYRFGIVLYNNKNIASPVHWIGDIRMPYPKEYPAFYADDYLYGKALGVSFKINSLPKEVVSYEIVRCDRTVNDKTVVMQSALSSITSYPYKYLNAGDLLATLQDCRPTLPLRFSDVSSTLWGLGVFTSDISVDSTGAMRRYLIKNDYATLIGAELDVNKESAIQYIKNAYVDNIYFLHSERKVDTTPIRIAGPKYTPYYSPFLTTLQSVDTYTNNKKNVGRLCGCCCQINEEPDRPSLLIDHYIAPDYPIPNYIAKRYVPYLKYGMKYTEDSEIKRVIVDLTDNVIFSNLLEQNDIVNKGAKYQSIGDISYLNLAHATNDKERYDTNVDKASYFGYCAVVKASEDIFKVLLPFPGMDLDNVNSSAKIKSNIWFPPNNGIWDIPIVNIKRNIIPYGGTGYVARTNSVYISTGKGGIVSDNTTLNANTFGGDTYLGIHDHRTGSIWPNPEVGGGEPNVLQTSFTDLIPFETTVNTYLLYGSTTTKSCIGDLQYTDVYLSPTITGGTLGNYHIQDKPYTAYNDAYSVSNTVKNYVQKGLYSKDTTYNNNRIIYSELKSNDEVTDSFTQFKIANYLDVDSRYGPITNLKSFNNSLYFWQEASLGVAAVNERSLMLDNNIGGLILGTGDILSRYDYATTGNGSSVINDPSIIDTASAMYWFDEDKNEICQLANGVSKISKDNTVLSWLNKDSRKVHDSIYDDKFNEVLFCFDEETLVYNERTKGFTSIYTFNPDNHASFSDKLLYVKDNKFKESADFPLNKVLCKLQYVVNDNTDATKTFDNIRFSGIFPNPKKMFKKIKFTTKHQEGEAFKDPNTGEYLIDYREDTYRLAVGRSNDSDPSSYPARMKGKYMLCDLTIDSSDRQDFNLPNINTTYRQSLV